MPIHKRRYLKTYLNPLQVIKKFEKNQHDLEIKTKYRILVKTGSGAHAATNSTVIRPSKKDLKFQTEL